MKQINTALSETGSAPLQQPALRMACRLVKAGKIAEGVQFARGLREVLLREDALYTVAALASRQGQAADVWKLVSSGLGLTETASICAGIVTGLAHPAAGK
jgi:hypothetical protein